MSATLPAADPGGSSAAALESHYDLGNDFFRLWLGQTMSYTSALWAGEDDTLDEAQTRKVDYHCGQVHVQGAERVLDVGCGWGQLLRRAVQNYDVGHAVGLTLNQSHVDWIAAFDEPRIETHCVHWADYVADEPFDRVFAWGVLEHAARADISESQKQDAYRNFFELCHQRLKPGGWLSLQTIVFENCRREDLNEFILTKIFPESDLPRIGDIARATERMFEVRALVNHREHYVRTLKAWHRLLRANRDEAVALVGEEMFLAHEKYLSLFIIGFHTGTMNLSRWSMRRIDSRRA